MLNDNGYRLQSSSALNILIEGGLAGPFRALLLAPLPVMVHTAAPIGNVGGFVNWIRK